VAGSDQGEGPETSHIRGSTEVEIPTMDSNDDSSIAAPGWLYRLLEQTASAILLLVWRRLAG